MIYIKHILYLLNIYNMQSIKDAYRQKDDGLKKVASIRVANVIIGIRSLLNSSKTNNYHCNEDDVNKMSRAIREEVKVIETLNNNKDIFNF